MATTSRTCAGCDRLVPEGRVDCLACGAPPRDRADVVGSAPPLRRARLRRAPVPGPLALATGVALVAGGLGFGLGLLAGHGDGQGAGRESRDEAARPVLLAATGAGAQTTERFTVASTAEVRYAYRCSAPGFFEIYVNGGQEGVLAATSERSGAASSFLNEPGSYYLNVTTSTCSWSLEVLG